MSDWSTGKRSAAQVHAAPKPPVPRYVALRRLLTKVVLEASDAGEFGELGPVQVRLPDGEPEDEANGFGVEFANGELLVVEVMEP